MKKVIKGWIGKDDSVDFWWEDNGLLEASAVWEKKGKKEDWGANWPPKPVTITIEVDK